jgi:hypothetical protein
MKVTVMLPESLKSLRVLLVDDRSVSMTLLQVAELI